MLPARAACSGGGGAPPALAFVFPPLPPPPPPHIRRTRGVKASQGLADCISTIGQSQAPRLRRGVDAQSKAGVIPGRILVRMPRPGRALFKPLPGHSFAA